MLQCNQEVSKVQNIIQQLLKQDKGLIFLSAPTNSGKTKIVRHIKEYKPKTEVISAEQFFEALVQPIKSKGRADLLEALRAHSYICIEDLDWYGGREYTEYAFAAELSRLAESAVVLVTGVALKFRMQAMFSKLHHFDYFERSDIAEGWTKDTPQCDQKENALEKRSSFSKHMLINMMFRNSSIDSFNALWEQNKDAELWGQLLHMCYIEESYVSVGGDDGWMENPPICTERLKYLQELISFLEQLGIREVK